jgi:putative iron-only hydrogenase system regulator
MKRIGVVGIVIEDTGSVSKVNEILHNHGHIIVGRMGIPYKTKNINVISIIVDGTTDDIGSLTGKLGTVSGITVKSALTKKNFHDN